MKPFRSTVFLTVLSLALSYSALESWAGVKPYSSSKPGIIQKLEKVTGVTPKLIKVSGKDNPKDSIQGYLAIISTYSDLSKARHALHGTGYSVFICNLDRWNSTREDKPENISIDPNQEHYYVLATNSLTPSQAVRALGGPQISDSGVTREDTASLLEKWSAKYRIRIDSLSDNAIDIEFLEKPDNLRLFFENLGDFDPSLIGVDKSDKKAYSKRINEMISYFKKFKVVTLFWR